MQFAKVSKRAAKFLAQNTLGRLPPSTARLSGSLAVNGGIPVRDVRLRPWASSENGRTYDWIFGVGHALKHVFNSKQEGLPQPLAQRFAEQWAEYCGCRYALLLPHGTDALRFALAAALDHDGLEYGGEVIVPNLSFIASAFAALDRRVGIVLVDVDPDTLLLDPGKVRQAIVPGKTRALMPVHLFGQPADMIALNAIAAEHGLKVVEDAAQAHGATWGSIRTGNLADAAAFSFQSFKNLSCGEGGALTTNDGVLFDRAYALHNVGRSRQGGERWKHNSLGWNCRPTEYQAALLLHRLAKLERQQERRRQNFDLLDELFQEVDCVRPLKTHANVGRHGAHMFVMRYRAEACNGLPIDEFLEVCGAEGAPIYRGYECTLAQQPAVRALFQKRPDYVRLMDTPVADQAVQELLYIPQEVLLGTKQDMRDITRCVVKVQSHFQRRGDVAPTVHGLPACVA